MPDPNKNQDNFIPVAPKYEDGPVLIQFPSAKLPIFWGPGQLLDETTLAYVVPIGWHDFEPLKIPRVGRMIYGGKAETDTDNYAPIPPNSPPPPPPSTPNKCEWTYEIGPKSRLYFLRYDAYANLKVRADFVPWYAAGYGIEYEPGKYIFSFSDYKPNNDWNSIIIRIRSHEEELIYEGPMSGAPFFDWREQSYVNWVFKCEKNPNLVLDSYFVTRRGLGLNTPASAAAPECWVARGDGSYYSEVPIQHHEEYGCGPYPG